MRTSHLKRDPKKRAKQIKELQNRNEQEIHQRLSGDMAEERLSNKKKKLADKRRARERQYSEEPTRPAKPNAGRFVRASKVYFESILFKNSLEVRTKRPAIFCRGVS